MGLEQKVLNALVIDDNPGVLGLVQALLTAHGVTYASFSTCEEGLAHFLKNPPLYDLVITDLNQSPTSGADVALKVKDCSQGKIPVYIITGGADAALIELAKRYAGEKRIIYKPFKNEKFKDIIDEVRRFKDEVGQPSQL